MTIENITPNDPITFSELYILNWIHSTSLPLFVENTGF